MTRDDSHSLCGHVRYVTNLPAQQLRLPANLAAHACTARWSQIASRSQQRIPPSSRAPKGPTRSPSWHLGLHGSKGIFSQRQGTSSQNLAAAMASPSPVDATYSVTVGEPPIPAFQAGERINGRGQKLYTVLYLAQAPRAALVWHHGYGEHVGRMNYGGPSSHLSGNSLRAA